MTCKSWCSTVVTLSLLTTGLASAQGPPVPIYLPPPPPPTVRVYVAPPAPPMGRMRMRSGRGPGPALTVVGALLLSFGILAVIGGGVVLIVGAASPATDPCPACSGVGYGLLIGGGIGVVSGIALIIVGKILSIDAAFSQRTPKVVPTFALGPSLGGAFQGTAGLGFRF